MALTLKKTPLNSIWDCPKVTKNSDNSWTCGWCKVVKQGISHNRALAHVAKMKVYNQTGVKFCEAKIDPCKLEEYRSFANELMSIRDRSETRTVSHKKSIENSQESICSRMSENKFKSSVASVVTEEERKAASAAAFAHSFKRLERSRNFRNGKNIEEPSLSDLTDAFTPTPIQKHFSGTSIAVPKFTNQLMLSYENDTKMDVAIADLIASKGLPFSLVEDMKFRNLIESARKAPANYKPPSRKRIAGELLDQLHFEYKETATKKLKQSVMHFGLSVMGDGATIRKKTLINFLVSGVNIPIYVAKIYDCSQDLEVGQNKCSEFIERQIRPIVNEFDPNKCYFDLAMFDGAKNVQTAGKLMEQLNPRLTTIHGCEHVVSLFFQDLLNKTKLTILLRIYWVIFNCLGSGSSHMPHALFKKHAQANNGGKAIGLIRAAGTRMGGWFYAFHRLLRVRRALENTIMSEEWRREIAFPSNPLLKTQLEAIIRCDEYFDCIKALVIILFPCIKTLRLADCNKPGMDKIYYFTRQTTVKLNAVKEKLDVTFNEDGFSELVKNVEEMDSGSKTKSTKGKKQSNTKNDKKGIRTCQWRTTNLSWMMQ